jgi:hypothetical protein
LQFSYAHQKAMNIAIKLGWWFGGSVLCLHFCVNSFSFFLVDVFKIVV